MVKNELIGTKYHVSGSIWGPRKVKTKGLHQHIIYWWYRMVKSKTRQDAAIPQLKCETPWSRLLSIRLFQCSLTYPSVTYFLINQNSNLRHYCSFKPTNFPDNNYCDIELFIVIVWSLFHPHYCSCCFMTVLLDRETFHSRFWDHAASFLWAHELETPVATPQFWDSCKISFPRSNHPLD